MEFKRVHSIDFNAVQDLISRNIQEAYHDNESIYNFVEFSDIQQSKVKYELEDETAFCYAIYKEEEAVGYCLMYIIQERFQHNKITAVCSSIFIDKSVRSFKLFKDFITYVELELIDEEIDIISLSVKRKYVKLFEKLFYEEEEVNLTKLLTK